MNVSNVSNATTPSPSVPSPSVPSPSVPSPSVQVLSVPSPTDVPAPTDVPSPSVQVLSVPAPFSPITPSPYVPTTEEIALQQFLLAFVASLLCLFLMFRNKERIMKRTFQSRNYTHIVVDDDSARLVEMPEIDDIHYMEEQTDDEQETAEQETAENEV